MTRTTRILAAIFILSICLGATASLNAGDIRSYWKVGETREYIYRLGTTLIGTQSATFAKTQQTGTFGTVCVFEMTSEQDLSPVGEDTKLSYTSEIHYTLSGTPVAYKGTYVDNGDTSTVRFVLEGNNLRGVTSGISQDSTFSLSIPPGTFVCDQNFVAHWQMVVGTLPELAGEDIRLNVVIPRAQRRVPISGSFIGTDVIRSRGVDVECQVFEVHEANLRLFIDSDLKLARAFDTRRNLAMDLVGGVGDMEGTSEATSESSLSAARVVAWFAFLLIGIGLTGIMARPDCRYILLWIMFAVGGALFALVMFVQAPIQRELLKAAFGAFGTGAVLASFISAVVAALFQESLKYGILKGMLKFVDDRPKLLRMLLIGFAVGAGFGCIEAGWLAPDIAVTGFSGLAAVILAERVIFIFFHAATGALIGYGIGRKLDRMFWVIVAILHFFARFLFVLVTKGIVDAFFYEMALAVFVGLVFYVLVKLKINVRYRSS